MITITLIDEVPTTWNKFYAGGHWSDRRNLAHYVHQIVIYQLYQLEVDKPVTGRVDILITAYINGRGGPMDPCNLPAKLYIDGLVQGGLLVDDSYKYVRRVTTEIIRRAKESKVVIEVTPTGEKHHVDRETKGQLERKR